jgi:phosphoglycerol transferase MdoB-like AlkP superfamily enzyme
MWDTKRNGILLNFTINLKNTRVEKPEGYSMEAVKTLADSTGIATTDYSKPNVIVIMNEAFSDLSVLGDVKTNTDSLPFIRSLTENTVKGYAYSSVFGGHTANSEYEFITGNTMAFLPSGTVAYQMYVENGDYNLGSQFKSLGYNTTFLHPYYSSGWNRNNVYRDFGFDDVLFQNQFWGAQYIRKYISDKSDYQTLIRNYETDSSKGPVFMFNVTMQNHGGYSKERENLDESVYLTGDLEGKFENADTYLSLMHETDSAFKGLVDYFSKVEKPTIILMFGDHQPDLGDSFYEKIFGKSQDSLTMDESSKKYKIPFVIWANYDIKEQSGIETSINYLSTLLMKTAGLPLTGYQEFLSQASDRIPVITNINFREEGGTMTNKTADLSEESQKLLNDYRILQYNGINDKKNRLDKLFFLGGDNMISASPK